MTWLRDANCAEFTGSVDFEDARSNANGLAQGLCGLIDGSVAGDWRLPNIKELKSLVDYGQFEPALPAGHLFISLETLYWSSTSNIYDPARAWYLSMATGATHSATKTFAHYVWPVRGGHDQRLQASDFFAVGL